MSDGILWLSFFLIVVVIFTVYRPVLSAMLFDPTYFAGAGTPSGGPSVTAGGAAIQPGINANPSRGVGI